MNSPIGMRLVAVSALVSGVTSAIVVAIPGGGSIIGGGFAADQATIYGPGHAALAVALTLAGVALLAAASARRPERVVALVGVIGLCSSQLAGFGLVGYRRWPHYWGCCAPDVITHQGLLRTLALVMAVVCAVTALVCLSALAGHGLLRWQGRAAAVAFPVAVVAAVAIPPIMAGDWSATRDLIAAALTYSLPFAAALAVSALMDRRAALVVAAAVACSALIAGTGGRFLESRLPLGDAQLLAVGAAVLVGLARLVPRETPDLEGA